MTSPLDEVVREARAKENYRCARCDYPLGDVPLGSERCVTCPECGYEMVFEVKVQLLPRDPEFDREIRSRLGRLERMVLPVSLVLMAMMIGLIIVVVMLVL